MGDATNGTNGTNGTNDHHHELPALAASAADFLAQEYDYVIIGGGTAGLVLAGRLTENPDVTVGVLEAGKNKLNDPLVDTPALFTQMLGNAEYDWNLKTVPQAGDGNRVHHVPRGKVLGGSSGTNYMMYVRGSERDYDDWATLADDPAWGFASMRQYITKHQMLEPVPETITNRAGMATVGANHGTSGPIHTSFNDTRLDVEDAFLVGADDAASIKKKPVDAWSGDHYGFYNGLGSVYRTGPLKGKRSYAARGYFEENAARPNLKVICEAPATSIILDESNKTATGVNFTHAGEKYAVKAKREVILSGGVIHSPQLLELSGIGNPEVLRKAGVEVKVDLPSVGENYQDHVVSGIGWDLAAGGISLNSLYHPDVMAEAQKALVEHAAGPLTGVVSGQGFVSYKQLSSKEELDETIASIRETQKSSTPFQKRQLDLVIQHLEDDKSANVQYILVPIMANFGVDAVNDQSKLWPPGDPAKPGVTWVCCLQYPVSRGSIHISSADPSAAPTIDPAYLKHPADLAVLGNGLKFADKTAKSSSLAPHLGKRIHPAPSVDLQDTEGSRQGVRDWIIGEYHSVGSCAMGDTVDSRLKVKGVQRLRVVDASVFPNHVSGNCQSSVYALAEKAADIIKHDNDYAALDKQL